MLITMRIKAILDLQRYDQKIVLLFLCILCILTRIPWLLFVATDDPGDDAAWYINIAHNISTGNGYTSDFKEAFYDNEANGRNNEFSSTAFFEPPAYPTFLGIVFLLGYSAYLGKVAQTILFCLFIVVYYSFTQVRFGNKIALFSSLLIIFDPIGYENSVHVMTDILSLFFIFSAFYVFEKNKENLTQTNIFTLALFCTLASLTRETNLILIIMFSLLLFKKDKPTNFCVFIATLLLLLFPWYLYVYSETGYFFTRFSTSYLWPGSEIILATDRTASVLSRFMFGIREVHSIVNILVSAGTLTLIMPFVILGTIDKLITSKQKDPYLLFALLTAFFYTFIFTMVMTGHARDRYFIVVVAILVPIGIERLLKFEKAINFPERIKKLISFTSLILIISIFISCANIGVHAYVVKENSFDDSRSYSWLDQNNNGTEIVAFPNSPRIPYFTSLQCVKLPYNVDDNNLDAFIEFYNVDFIIVESLYESYYDHEYTWVQNSFSGENTTLFNYELLLVNEYEKPNGDFVHTYRVAEIS